MEGAPLTGDTPTPASMMIPVLGGLVMLIAAGLALGRATADDGWLFLMGAAPTWALVVAMLLVFRRQEGHRGPLGPATLLTLGRGLLLSALAGFGPLAWQGRAETSLLVSLLPGLLYTTAALADLVDGYVARRTGDETALGGRLDVAMDALGLVVAPLVAIGLGRLPAFYLIVGAAYYLYHLGHWWRRRQGRPVFPLRPSRVTRMYAGYQMGMVATVLFPVVGPPGTTAAAALFMVPNLTLFLRDWLVTTGRLDDGGARYRRLVGVASALGWELMLLTRVLAAAALSAAVAQGRLHPGLLVLAGTLLLGVATRLSAYVAVLFLCAAVAQAPTPLLAAGLLLTLTSLLGGGGRAALLREERWLLLRAGERAERE